MAVHFGIAMHEGALVESVDREKTIETGVLKGSNGNTKHVHTYDDLIKFNLKTRGDASALDVGVGDPDISGISGGVTVIESVKDGEVNTDYPTAEASGTNYPHATEIE